VQIYRVIAWHRVPQCACSPAASCTLLLIRAAGPVAAVGAAAACTQVLRGYVGDRQSKPVFQGSTPFDILGTGYQRPFELATLRLFNMVGILPKCECLQACQQHKL
jgi:hypothetical protein